MFMFRGANHLDCCYKVGWIEFVDHLGIVFNVDACRLKPYRQLLK